MFDCGEYKRVNKRGKYITVELTFAVISPVRLWIVWPTRGDNHALPWMSVIVVENAEGRKSDSDHKMMARVMLVTSVVPIAWSSFFIRGPSYWIVCHAVDSLRVNGPGTHMPFHVERNIVSLERASVGFTLT